MMIRPAFLRGLVFALILVALGCGAVAAWKGWTGLKREVQELTREVQVFNGQQDLITDLQDQITNLETHPAILDATSKGFGYVDTDTGKFLISCDDVQRYLDGQKLELAIGNLNSASYEGFTFKVKWGRREPPIPAPLTKGSGDTKKERKKWLKDYEAWKKEDAAWKAALRSKEISFTDELKPGSWNFVDLVLTPAQPDEVGYVEISMDVDASNVLLLFDH